MCTKRKKKSINNIYKEEWPASTERREGIRIATFTPGRWFFNIIISPRLSYRLLRSRYKRSRCTHTLAHHDLYMIFPSSSSSSSSYCISRYYIARTLDWTRMCIRYYALHYYKSYVCIYIYIYRSDRSSFGIWFWYTCARKEILPLRDATVRRVRDWFMPCFIFLFYFIYLLLLLLLLSSYINTHTHIYIH